MHVMLAQASCGPNHTALLLRDGRVWRLHVGVISAPDVNARASSGLQQGLDRAKRELESGRRKIKMAQDELKKLEDRRCAP